MRASCRRYSTGWWLAIILVSGGSPRVLAADAQLVPPPSERALELMRQLDTTDPYQQEMTFLRLEALRETASSSHIRKYLTERNPDKRAWALRALASIEGVAAVPLLIRSVQNDREPRVRIAALLGLEPLQPSDPSILPVFLKALKDKHPYVRMAVVDIVSRIDDPRAREAVLTRQQRERNGDVRRVVALAVARVQSP